MDWKEVRRMTFHSLAVFLMFATLPVALMAQSEKEVPPSVNPPASYGLSDASPFEMTDGYFYVEKGRPVHLMHGPVSPQVMQLGEEYSFWTTLALREGAANPCSRRDEVPCRFEFRRIPDGTNYTGMEFKMGHEFRIGADGWMDFFFNTTLLRSSPLGAVNQVIRVRKDDDILYVYELPFRVVR